MKQKGGKINPIGKNYTDLYTNKEIIDIIRKYESSHTMDKAERETKFGSSDIMNTNTQEHMESLRDMLIQKIISDHSDKLSNIEISKSPQKIKFPAMPGKCTKKNSKTGKIIRETCAKNDLPDNYEPRTGLHDNPSEKAPLLKGGMRKRSRRVPNKKSSNSRNMARSTRRSTRKSSRRSTRKNNVTMGGKRRRSSTRRRRTSRK